MSFECSLKDYVRIFTLFFFNFASLIFGFFLIFIGTRHFFNTDWNLTKYIGVLFSFGDTEVNVLGSQKSELPDTLLIIVGICFSVISFFGCCGAAIKNTYCLKLNAAINLVLIGTLIILSAVGYNKFSNTSRDDVKRSIEDGFKSPDKYAAPINFIQTTFSCCGYNGITDYPKNILISCCSHSFENTNCTSNSAYKKPCKDSIEPLVNQFCHDQEIGKLILKISSSVGVFLLTLVIFAATMADKIQDYRRGLYYGDLYSLSPR